MFRPLVLILTLCFLISCSAAPTATLVPATGTPTQKLLPTRTATSVPPTETPKPEPKATTLWLEPNLESSLRAAIQEIAQAQQIAVVSVPDQATLRVTLVASPDPLLLTESVYVVADRFATLRSGVKFADVQQVWQGNAAPSIAVLIVTKDTAAALTPILGVPGENVRVVAPEALTDTVWQTPRALAILPFDQLSPRLIAQPIDGQNILDRTLNVSKYPLVVRVYVQGSSELAPAFYNALHDRVAATNRDANRMTSIVMTGVTAMGRFTAQAIDDSGDPAFPARIVAPILSQADITHVSNEIPFVDDCPPNLVHDSIRLCSKSRNIETFKVLGVDIVGLTGNHAGDFGYDNYVKTLELYEANGMKYYAGGRNEAEARKPLIVEHNGNRIAFLGANSFGPQSYWATEDKAGTNGYDAVKMKADIALARKQADLVFVEYQADEVYEYTPDATNEQIFRRTLKDGADVVTGVQNHHPASVEFGDNGKREILYGLGNFSFDQMYDDEVRGGLIPRHLIYNGKLLQTELLTTMLDKYAQPRWATPPERENILRGVFGASGFKLE
jgi:hypothetical protein